MPDTVVAPDLEGRGLAESVEALIADGFHPQVRGAGVVRAQEPPGGTPVPEGATIQLHCSLSAEAFDVSR